MSETLELEKKFKLILKGFLHENYKNSNDLYFEMVISHLSGKNGRDYSSLLHSKTTIEWIDECLNILSNDFKRLNEKVITFMLKLTALLTENEWLVIQVRERKLADRIQNLMIQNQSQLTPSIKLGYVRFLSAVSKYSLGIAWIRFNKAWSILISFCRENHTIYVIREAKCLIYEILEKFATKTNNDDVCQEMIKEIMQPLIDNTFDEQSVSVNVDDTDLQNKISPILDLICYILQCALESDYKSSILTFFDEKFQLDKIIWKYLETTHNQQFLGQLLKVLTSLNFTKLVYDKWINGKIPSQDFNRFGVNFYNYLKFCVLRRSCSNILMLAEYNHILWKKLGTRAPAEIIIENEKIEFESQLTLVHLMPVLIILKPGDKSKECLEVFDNYILKMFNITNEFTQRIAYSFREVLLDCPENILDLSCKSINGILSLQNSLNQTQAVLVFQAMTYAIKTYTASDSEMTTVINGPKKSTVKIDIFKENPNFLCALVTCLHTMVDKYKITWKDSIETTCLLSLVLNLLENRNLTSRVAVQSIKLAQLSIERFLSPNMALLMNNFNESGMQNLEPMIVKRLHDNSWEVRDSTLELITSIVSISEMKFPPFQQFILDSGVCPIVFSMAKNDSEPYVRASAFKCLAEMTVINMLWEKSICQLDILNFALSSIENESEGIVRKEAVTLITKISINRKVAPIKSEKLFSIMSNCAVNDFHWEVKIYALKFWKLMICQQFTNQGMIDGTFPTVTFSKEHKKIVTLTEKEIHLRINKILDELSRFGCLGVLLECLHDTCDLEVIKVTVTLLNKIFECLNKYDFFKNIIDTNDEEDEIQSPMECTNDEITNENEMEVNDSNERTDIDSVIESILDSSDLNLLTNGYQSHMNPENNMNGIKEIDIFYYKRFAKVKPKHFVKTIIKMNLDSLVEVKQNWMSDNDSFESLLDDMIFSIKTLDVNDADCY